MFWRSFPSNSLLPGAALVCLGLAACGAPEAGGPRILTGSDELVLATLGRSGTSTRLFAGSRISEILPEPPGSVWLATWSGLTRVPGPAGGALAGGPTTTDSLGILDGVERDPHRGLLYLLRHPGTDPGEIEGDHQVLEWEPVERRVLRRWTVDRFSYDLHLDPGRGILVTPLSGRRLWWVSLEEDEARPIDLPPAPGRPPPRRTEAGAGVGVSFVRIGAVIPGERKAVVVEQGLPDRNRVWRLDPRTGESSGFDLPRSCHYQGGALAPDGRTLVLNAIEAVEVIDLGEASEVAWIPLGERHFRLALGPRGRYAYLTAAKPEGEGGRVTTVDLIDARVARRSVVPVRADAIAVWAG